MTNHFFSAVTQKTHKPGANTNKDTIKIIVQR